MSHDSFKCLKDHVIVFQFKLIFLKTRDPLYRANGHMTIFNYFNVMLYGACKSFFDVTMT